MSLREDVVSIARSHIGEGPKPEWRGVQWCGLFALSVLHEAGLARDIAWHIGGGFVLENPHAFPYTTDPHPGDIGIVQHNRAGKDVWHYVILERISDIGVAWCIAGNAGLSPGHVAQQEFPISRPDLRWYSIEPVEAVP